MNIIGITGSSGAGKSTVCDILQNKYQVKIIDADEIAKHLSKRGTNYIEEIVKKFGPDILDEEGELKRKKLAELIYTDSKKRKELNDCTFKYIREEIQKQIREEKEMPTIVIDAPLLFESKLDKLCHCVVGVISKRELQVERIVARDNTDYEHAEKRLSAQKENEFYIQKCNEIIENNNNIAYVEKCVDKLAKKYNITKKLQ